MIKKGFRWAFRVMIALVPAAVYYAFILPPDPLSEVIVLMGAVLGIVAYSILTAYLCPPEPERETRCRKCGYILRGIPEPRCSECGERI